MPNIAVVWDFDGTLTPDDSTTHVVECLEGEEHGKIFWPYIKSLRGDRKLPKWEHILAMDAPIWMYSLSRIAFKRKVPLNKEFFKEFVLPKIKLYENVVTFLQEIKSLESTKAYKKANLKIHHFVVSAGLKDLLEQVFPDGLITWTYGCRYTIVADPDHTDEPESVPVFCIDETGKTRALFEISKGSFDDETRGVNKRVEESHLWAPFKNMIYVGDGETDIPSLSLTRKLGGNGIVVFNPKKSSEEISARLREMSADKRADLIAAADFSLKGELFSYIVARCEQIRQRYEAENFV